MATVPVTTAPGAIQRAASIARALHGNLSAVIRGKDEAIRLAVVTVLAGGHLLLEDVPGVGKTLFAKTLARSIHGTFRRVQGTPDLLPADLTGVAVLDQRDGTWKFRHGPLFANVVLVDEINRATPRTQSALLEAMEEGQVSADGGTLRLPDPFVVIGTQNPHEHAGTFPLVEGQRDRFTMILQLGLPDRESERAILNGTAGVDAMHAIAPVADAEALRSAVATVRTIHVADTVADYLLDIVHATRTDDAVALGASPRASLSLLRAAQAHALLDGRDFVRPDDVKLVAPAALAHRLIPTGGASLTRGRAIVTGILRSVPPPRG